MDHRRTPGPTVEPAVDGTTDATACRRHCLRRLLPVVSVGLATVAMAAVINFLRRGWPCIAPGDGLGIG